jgi:8-oxo-dGTP pyrophosphatase MutT (NUDIX family)
MASVAIYIECPITGRILGVARKDDPNAWGLPGGKVEDGESEYWAACRELQEETGIVCTTWDLGHEVFRRDGGVTFQLPFHHIAKEIVPVAKGEARVDWITPEQLLAGPFGEYNRRLLKVLGKI